MLNDDAVSEVAEVVLDATTAYPRDVVIGGLIEALGEIVREMDDPDLVYVQIITLMEERWR